MHTHLSVSFRLAATTLACAAALTAGVSHAESYFAVLPVAKASVPQHAYQAGLSVSADSLVADGSSTATITATVTDREGRPAGAGVPVAWSTSLGVLISQDEATDAVGTAHAVLQAGAFEGTATVRGMVGGWSNTIDVKFSALPPEECQYDVDAGYAAWDGYYGGSPSGALFFSTTCWAGGCSQSATFGYAYEHPIPEGSSYGLPAGYKRGRLMESAYGNGSWSELLSTRFYEICKISVF